MMKKIFLGLVFMVAVIILTACSSSSKKEVETPEVTPTISVAVAEATPTPSADSYPFDEEKARGKLTELGLNDKEIEAVIEIMGISSSAKDLDKYDYKSDAKDLDNYTYKSEDDYTDDVENIIQIEDSKVDVQTVNLMDYLGLNSRHAYLYQVNSRLKSPSHINCLLGRGTVEGKDVYAIADYMDYTAIGEAPSLNKITLYQVDNQSITVTGDIRYGEVSWRTDLATVNYPLIMDVGHEYTFLNNDDSLGVYQKREYEILGFTNVTVNGKKFKDCLEFQEISMSDFATGAASVYFNTWYYAKDLGYVLLKSDNIFISANQDKNITASLGCV